MQRATIFFHESLPEIQSQKAQAIQTCYSDIQNCTCNDAGKFVHVVTVSNTNSIPEVVRSSLPLYRFVLT